ncbi:hypothetical protein HF521_016774 [Silurus meridionalis]|uniref:Uncharacterized protein n=1 Tax=Silurus meridionalis TaxID=175797 RepID=A0A8T0BSA8_SILME|nr:hypothetical protein HF521_016774 [Silurus meridionalis]
MEERFHLSSRPPIPPQKNPKRRRNKNPTWLHGRCTVVRARRQKTNDSRFAARAGPKESAETTPSIRRQGDAGRTGETKFAAISSLWTRFTENRAESFTSGEHLLTHVSTIPLVFSFRASRRGAAREKTVTGSDRHGSSDWQPNLGGLDRRDGR